MSSVLVLGFLALAQPMQKSTVWRKRASDDRYMYDMHMHVYIYIYVYYIYIYT